MYLLETPVQLVVALLVKCLVCGNVDRKLINMDTLRLVTDLDTFNQYPWGKKAFDCLHQFIMDFKEWFPGKPVYQIGGFYHVPQVFTLEVFPRLADFCATKDLRQWPRILWWTMRKGHYKSGYNTLQKGVFSKKVIFQSPFTFIYQHLHTM